MKPSLFDAIESRAGDDEQVVAILDQYLIDLEAGKPVDSEAIVAAHPELAESLQEAFDALNLLQRIEPPRGPLPDLLDRPRDEFDGYRLAEEIGRGAAGVVYAATEVKTGRSVAIKVLALGSSLHPDRVTRFQREAAAASRLHHPHIVSVIGVGRSEGRQYYAMNRVDGASLDRRILAAKEQPHSPLAEPLLGPDRYKKIARFMADAADALAHAHQAGIVHRDIKPSNLLLTDAGHLWVADFGLARIGQEADLTRTGDLVGTIRYMSPEQASGRTDHVDGRTDIYALGATLYELVLLRPTFDECESARLLRAIQSRDPIAPRSLDRDVPKALETIIRRAMRRARSERYASATELAADLRRFATGQDVLASPVTVGERWRSYVRDHSHVVAVCLAFAVLISAASLVHGVVVSRQQSRTDAALALSEKNYQRTRRVVDTLGANVAQQLAAIPEAAELRQQLLAETLGYYEAFLEDAIEDPSLSADVAVTRLKIAQLMRISDAAVIDTEHAYRTAIDAFESLEDPFADSSLAATYVEAVTEWAMLASEQEDAQEAVRRLDVALRLTDGIADPLSKRLAAAKVHNNRGVVAIKRGDRETAAEEIEAAVALFDSLRNTDDPVWREERASDLSAAMVNLATLLSESGDAARAASLMQAAIAMTEPDGVDLGGSAAELRRRAIAHNNLAALHWKANRPHEAIAAYGRSISLLERALALAPNQPSTQRELAVTLNNQGMALTSAERFEDAEVAFRRAVAIIEPAATANPTDLQVARQCGGVMNNLGVLLKQQGRLRDARDAFAKALEYQQRAGKLAPDDATNHRFLDQIRHNFVSVDG